MLTIADNTPIAMLTVGQLRELLNEQTTTTGNNTPKVNEHTYQAKKFVYGLSGIRRLFNCGHTTAQKYKDGILKEAVTQCGKKIIVDADKALELFSKHGKQ